MTEYEKMLAGVWYYPGEEELAALHQRAVALCYAANHLPPEREEERMELLRPLFGKTGAEFTITPDFHCDYGGNITLGEGFYANYNLVILDCPAAGSTPPSTPWTPPTGPPGRRRPPPSPWAATCGSAGTSPFCPGSPSATGR